MKKDIFISYKNDNAGNNFAERLKRDLENHKYSVYFNSDEKHSGNFPEKLRTAVEDCKDFILIVSQKCLDQLIENKKIDWIREEILTAKNAGKPIIPIMLDGVKMPSDVEVMPEELRFLPMIDNITMPEKYDISPYGKLLSLFKSKPEKDDIYRETYNDNPYYDVVADFKSTLERAQAGSIKDMFEIATMYYYGFADENGGSQRDFEKAYFWLQKIIDDGTDTYYKECALSIVAEMYFHGIIPREAQSYEKALKCHQEAEKVSGFSAREYAYLSSRGCGCNYDFEATVSRYTNAIEQGDNVALVGLAKIYTEHGMFEKAAELYRKTSGTIPESGFRLGMLYRNGLLSNPPMPNFYQAAFWFQHAIGTGKCRPEVYHELGRLYFMPIGDFPKDFAAAERYFKIAADRGNREAQHKLGIMYQYGYVKKDIGKALHYHTEAAKQGTALSAYQLSLIYQQEECRNYHQAYRYAQMAADNGIMEGEFVLANLLYFGRGCEPDVNKAYEYYKKAEEHGMPQARFMREKIESN